MQNFNNALLYTSFHVKQAKNQEGLMERTSENKSVLLTITGVQTDISGKSTETSAVYEAVYRAESTGHFFQYSADGEDAFLYLSSERACMERGKDRETRMLFDPSVPHTECLYRTPYGTIHMEIRTEGIVIMDGGHTGAINDKIRIRGRIKYVLTMERDEPINCSVTIKAQQIK